MKAPVTPEATRRVLAGIDAVLRERTAAAVERVLATASPGCSEAGAAFAVVTMPLLGLRALDWRGDNCPFCRAAHEEVDGLEEWFYYYLDADVVPVDERRRYAPEVVSPHLLGGAR